jgi:hypothetical protein
MKKIPLGRPRLKWDYIIRDLKNIGGKIGDWIQVIHVGSSGGLLRTHSSNSSFYKSRELLHHLNDNHLPKISAP